MAGKLIADFQYGDGSVITGLVNDLITGGAGKALTAEQGKLLFNMFANSKTSSGFQKFPNGLILQWAFVVPTSSGFMDWVFPIAFPNAVLTALGSVSASAADNVTALINNSTFTKTKMAVAAAQNNVYTTYGCNFFAIGH